MGAFEGATPGASVGALPPTHRPPAEAGGVVAAVTAYAYLWPCRRVGARARTFGRPLLRNATRIEIGDDAVIDSRGARVELACEDAGRLVIGHGVRIGPGARLVANGYVEVGDRVRIGAGCVILDGAVDGAHPEGIWIGDAVTLGEGVRVLAGAVIGTGAVVAPGTVVSGRIGPGEVVDGGTPASGPAGGRR